VPKAAQISDKARAALQARPHFSPFVAGFPATKNPPERVKYLILLEARTGIEPMYTALQAAA